MTMTISTPMDMSALAQRLTSNTWTLAAISALFESGLAEQLREPHTVDELAAKCSLPSTRIERCLAVCVSVGVVIADGPAYRLAEGTLATLCGPMRAGMQADLRSQLMQALTFVDAMATHDSSIGWRHTDPTILQAQGDASAGFPPMFKARFVATLGDLAARLERPGARFLDVGVGVGALTISMCRLWPELHAVGLDIYDAPLALARDNLARANLGTRVELRQLAVEALRDEAAFDLAWLPSFFIPPAVLASANGDRPERRCRQTIPHE